MITITQLPTEEPEHIKFRQIKAVYEKFFYQIGLKGMDLPLISSKLRKQLRLPFSSPDQISLRIHLEGVSCSILPRAGFEIPFSEVNMTPLRIFLTAEYKNFLCSYIDNAPFHWPAADGWPVHSNSNELSSCVSIPRTVRFESFYHRDSPSSYIVGKSSILRQRLNLKL